MGPEALAQVLRPLLNLEEVEESHLVVGLEQPDDAVVYRLEDGTLLVLSADFFGPVVDDAYAYGAIAAANAISDIYAMGGTPFLALNLAAFPADMPAEVASAILRGGTEKAREAGVVVAGGHTMEDREPKYGLVVLGRVEPDRLLLKSGARVGERLVLTKPLGSGIIATCLKAGLASPEVVQEITGWMLRLNRDAAAAVGATHARGATDITGFGLLGHAVEMAHSARVRLRLEAERVPVLEAANTFAEQWLFPGGTMANEMYYSQWVACAAHIPAERSMLFYDPQTNGGILAAIPPQEFERFAACCQERGQPFWEIGQVVEGEAGVEVL